MPMCAGEWIDIVVDDGTPLRLWHVKPESPQGAIILLQEVFGVNAHIRDLAARFGAEGYEVVAPDLFHRTAPGFETGYDDLEGGLAQLALTTIPGLTADVRAAYAYLAQQGHTAIASVGYCMGGRVSFLANAAVPLQAAISYYGPLAPEMLPLAVEQHAPLLLFWGGQDTHIPSSAIEAELEALRKAEKPHTHVVFSEAGHGFFCDRRASYHAPSAQLSWTLTKAFLEQHLR